MDEQDSRDTRGLKSREEPTDHCGGSEASDDFAT